MKKITAITCSVVGGFVLLDRMMTYAHKWGFIEGKNEGHWEGCAYYAQMTDSEVETEYTITLDGDVYHVPMHTEN